MKRLDPKVEALAEIAAATLRAIRTLPGEQSVFMDTRDKALCEIAVDALRAIQRTAKGRHGDLWQLAIRHILDIKQQIEGDEEIAAIRPPRAGPDLADFQGDIGNDPPRFR